MNECKLQIGCLIVILYVAYIYVKETNTQKTSCNKFFDILLYIAPWTVLFDGITSWTVNHLDVVPNWLNLTFHALFFISMDVLIVWSFIYILDLTIGIPETIIARTLLLIPGIVSVIAILFFLPQTKYIVGQTTNYSMGGAPIACYMSVIAHYGGIIASLLRFKKTIEARKWQSTMTFVLLSLVFLAIQTIFPESLISALPPTLLILGFYINIEDPFYSRVRTYNEDMVTDFATLVENRDNSTGGHIKRTKLYVGVILDRMVETGEYKDILTKDYIHNVNNAAPMHDIGKISTPDHILQKPGKLTDEEYDIMKQHAVKGGEIIKETFSNLGNPEFEQIAYEVARHHHEKWNGRGYPDGLKAEEIPLHARVMAIADVFDAVSAKRVYRDAMPIGECFRIIEEGIGTDFDPQLARLFLESKEEVLAIYHGQKD